METSFTFSFEKAVRFAVDKALENWKTFLLLLVNWIGLTILASIVYLLVQYCLGVPLFEDTTITVFSQVISITWLQPYSRNSVYSLIAALEILYWFQLLSLSMALYEGKKITLRDAFSKNSLTFFKFLSAQLLLFLKLCGIVLLLIIPLLMIRFHYSTIMLLIPSLYLVTKNYFVGYSVIDQPSTAILEDAAISAQLTKNIRLRLLLLWVLLGLPTLFTLLPFAHTFPQLVIISPIFIVLVTLINVHIYKQMKEARLSR